MYIIPEPPEAAPKPEPKPMTPEEKRILEEQLRAMREQSRKQRADAMVDEYYAAAAAPAGPDGPDGGGLAWAMARNAADMGAYMSSKRERAAGNPGTIAKPWAAMTPDAQEILMLQCGQYLDALEANGVKLDIPEGMDPDAIDLDTPYAKAMAPLFDGDGNGVILELASTGRAGDGDIQAVESAAALLEEKAGADPERAAYALLALPALGIGLEGAGDYANNYPAPSVLGEFPGALDADAYEAAKRLAGERGGDIVKSLEDTIGAMDAMGRSGFGFQPRGAIMKCDQAKTGLALYGGMLARLKDTGDPERPRDVAIDAASMAIRTLAEDGVALHDAAGKYNDASFGYRRDAMAQLMAMTKAADGGPDGPDGPDGP